MRGLPGSGKTTFAKNLFPCALIFGADQNMTNEKGEYAFDPKKLNSCHKLCMLDFINALMYKNENVLIIDNTNTSAIEIAPYISVANAFDYESEIITLKCSTEHSVKNNTHGVPIEAVLKLDKKMQDPLPPFWKHTIIENYF